MFSVSVREVSLREQSRNKLQYAVIRERQNKQTKQLPSSHTQSNNAPRVNRKMELLKSFSAKKSDDLTALFPSLRRG